MKSPYYMMTALLIFFLSVSPSLAVADNDVSVSTSIMREVEVENEQGEKEMRLENVESAVPGDQIVLIITYLNKGEQPAENIVLTNPVPEEMIYVGGSAGGEKTVIVFSVDGGDTYDVPEKLFVVNESGERVQAKPGDYTHLRWRLTESLEPGGEGLVRFKAVLK